MHQHGRSRPRQRHCLGGGGRSGREPRRLCPLCSRLRSREPEDPQRWSSRPPALRLRGAGPARRASRAPRPAQVECSPPAGVPERARVARSAMLKALLAPVDLRDHHHSSPSQARRHQTGPEVDRPAARHSPRRPTNSKPRCPLFSRLLHHRRPDLHRLVPPRAATHAIE